MTDFVAKPNLWYNLTKNVLGPFFVSFILKYYLSGLLYFFVSYIVCFVALKSIYYNEKCVFTITTTPKIYTEKIVDMKESTG